MTLMLILWIINQKAKGMKKVFKVENQKIFFNSSENGKTSKSYYLRLNVSSSSESGNFKKGKNQLEENILKKKNFIRNLNTKIIFDENY